MNGFILGHTALEVPVGHQGTTTTGQLAMWVCSLGESLVWGGLGCGWQLESRSGLDNLEKARS